MFFPGHPGKPGRKKRRHWPESQVKSRIVCCRIAGTDFPARTVLSGSPYTLAFPLFGEIISAKDKTISGAEAFLLVWGLPDVPAGFTATRCKNRSSPGEPAVRWPIRADCPETCSVPVFPVRVFRTALSLPLCPASPLPGTETAPLRFTRKQRAPIPPSFRKKGTQYGKKAGPVAYPTRQLSGQPLSGSARFQVRRSEKRENGNSGRCPAPSLPDRPAGRLRSIQMTPS